MVLRHGSEKVQWSDKTFDGNGSDGCALSVYYGMFSLGKGEDSNRR